MQYIDNLFHELVDNLQISHFAAIMLCYRKIVEPKNTFTRQLNPLQCSPTTSSHVPEPHLPSLVAIWHSSHINTSLDDRFPFLSLISVYPAS